MLGEAIIGMNALKTAFDISRGLKDINDATVRNSAVIDLQEKILSAQQAQFELIKRIEDLEKEIAAISKSQKQLDRYKLTNYGGETFAYELKAETAEGEPIHRACPTCFQNNKISVLQFDFRRDTGQDRYQCPSCKAHFDFGARTERSRPPPSRGGWV